MQRNRGITLIALIITIVVMLILVAVSVNVLIKSNLIGTAEKTVNKYKTASEDEGNNGVIEINGKQYNSIDDYMEGKEKLPDIAAGARADKDSNYNGVTIPRGFTVSGIKDEQNKDNGLVIYDIPQADLEKKGDDFWTETIKVGTEDYPKVQCDYNQFVWVPVETPYVTKAELDKIINDSNGTITTEKEAVQSLANSGKYPMAVQLSNGTDYKGILYTFSEENGILNAVVVKFNTSDNYIDDSVTYFREPNRLSSKVSSCVDQTVEQTLDLQNEYNKIVESVKKQKGFWVARYELSHSTINSINKAESKRGKSVSSADSSSLNKWYGLYSTCHNVNLKNETEIKSCMIYGSQWDQIMIWMKNVKNIKDSSKYYVIDGSYMGNYDTATGGTGPPQVSGYKDDYAVKQIFDLGGNLYDWTVEAYQTHIRVLRGYSCNGKGFGNPPLFRSIDKPESTNNLFSARFTLYLS